jgi:hypothetical protein
VVAVEKSSVNPAALTLVPQHHHCPDCAHKDRVIADLSERLNQAGEEVHLLDVRDRKRLAHIKRLED